MPDPTPVPWPDSLRNLWTTSTKRLRELSSGPVPVWLVVLIALIALLLYLLPQLTSTAGNSLDSGDEEEGLGIKELVTQVKRELEAAESDRIQRGEEALFRVRDFNLEVTFVVRSSVRGRGEARFEVVSLNTELDRSSERVQRLTLHMVAPTPVRQESPASAVAGDTARPPGRVVIPP